jgi:Family of unknown function (DUF6178)
VTPTQPPTREHTDRLRQLAEKRREVLSMPAQQALAVILDHPQPAALVHSFADEDLHFLIHDIGPDDARPLLALASNRQWEYLLDMETWHKGQLNYQQITNWLQLLLRADPNRLIAWCFDERLEYLELYLFRNLELRVRESDEGPSDFGNGYLSDDDTLYVRAVDYPVATEEEEEIKARRNEVLKQLLSRLSHFDHLRYQGLLMEAANIIPAETEEELYRLRNVRLAEKGFLPFHEAVGVYQPLRPGDLAVRGKKIIRAAAEDSRYPVPQLASSFLAGDSLFVRALKGMGEIHVIQQLQMELASLCNQVISADQTIIRSRGQLQSVVAKVNGYLSIGLELVTRKYPGNREARAAVFLRRRLLADIFRTGYASALRLKWKASRWHKDSWSRPVDLTFWDEAWLGLLGGVLIDRPKFYDPSSPASNYRDFQTCDEIAATRRGLEQITAMDHLFKCMHLPTTPLAHIRFLTYKNLLLTLWARAALAAAPIENEASAITISVAAFKPFFTALWSQEEGRRRIGDGKKNEFLQWAAKASGQSLADLSDRLGAVFEALFDEMEQELSQVEAKNLDSRYIKLFLLQP